MSSCSGAQRFSASLLFCLALALSAMPARQADAALIFDTGDYISLANVIRIIEGLAEPILEEINLESEEMMASNIGTIRNEINIRDGISLFVDGVKTGEFTDVQFQVEERKGTGEFPFFQYRIFFESPSSGITGEIFTTPTQFPDRDIFGKNLRPNDGLASFRIEIPEAAFQNTVPEPSTILMWSLLGLVATCSYHRRQSKLQQRAHHECDATMNATSGV